MVRLFPAACGERGAARTFEHFPRDPVRGLSLVGTLDLLGHFGFQALLVLEAGRVDRRRQEQVHRDAVQLKLVPERLGEPFEPERNRTLLVSISPRPVVAAETRRPRKKRGLAHLG